MSETPPLERLATLCGIEAGYHDIWGKRHLTSDRTRRMLLAAMGVPPDADPARQAEDIENRDWRRPLPPVRVVRQSEAPFAIEVSVPAGWARETFTWTLDLEQGARHGGQFRPRDLEAAGERSIGGATFQRFRLPLPPIGEAGYHRLELERPGQDAAQPAQMMLIVVPADCYRPEALRNGGRVWGPAVQLYGVRSRRNWGIGDFGDVAALLEQAAESGAGIIGLNPLHALYPDNPAHCSPYSPSSRLFLNVLYIDVEAVADVAESKAARDLLASPRFQARLRRLRAAELVEYAEVGAAKLDALRLAWRHFGEQHLARNSERAHAFRQYCADQGEALRMHALFEALQAHFRKQDAAVWGWPAWPEAYRDPAAAEVAAFAAAHAAEVDFYRYLQWLAEQQLASAGLRSWTLGLGVGLYQDLALGVDPGGAEAWANRDVYAVGAHAGAPPDDFNLYGQDWGLPPFNPWRLRERAYAPFVATLRATMRHCGALRIDHVMGLMRLYWVPVGATPAEGAYVAYPLDDLLGILALESQRNRCLVIGEDLGTVPDALRPRLAELGVLTYRPFFFERSEEGAFKPPPDYPRQALVAVSTHDLPTLRGFWKGLDLDTRAALGLFPTEAMKEGSVAGRSQDRARLLMALQRENLLPADASIHPVSVPDITPELSVAVHRFLARTPAQVMVVQQEDVFGVAEQPNLPGSNEGHPNWRRRLPVPLEDWREEPRQQALNEAMRQERGSAVSPHATHAPHEAAERMATIPRATYRLQFNRDFTLAQAVELVPYLAELGISHCYASPYLKARPGSSHGYDIVDHNALNPEIGSAEDFERFVAALRAHGMGQLLDMVPNHMGVMGADNGWWLDVLENGQAAAHAAYFDIDWDPLNAELHGKVLLPLLGDHYGTVLNRGELKLGFDAAHGEFSLAYFQHRLPVDPAEYPRIVAHRLEGLVAALGAQHGTLQRLQSLVTAFGHLPPRTEIDPARCAERSRDKEMLKRQLAELCAASADVAHHIEENVAEFNGRPGDADSFELLHELIKAQTWRLAYWQVASDEINYRRFFDINDLAALRMENDAVFEDTHRLVLDWVAQDKVHGLRIDHPDGLYDPGRYFRHVQSRVCGRPASGAQAADAAAEPDCLPLYLVIEKIMAEHEWLPADWPIHGATGYRFANLANNLFVDAAAEKKMTRIYADFIGERIDFDELVYKSKKLIMRSALASELNVLANKLARIASASRYTCDFTLNNLRAALMEVVACFPVYRSYLAAGRISVDDQRHIEWAVAVARKRSPAADVSIFDFVRGVLTTQIAEGKNQAYRDRVWAFAMKFQQFTSPVMAKGLEDTSFYLYNRLASLNDVGGDPRRFGVSVSAFHAATRLRAERWPHNMLATSTHDSKRAEDVRARISVLSEIPAAWKLSLKRWSRMNRSKKRSLDGALAPCANDEYLLYQTLIGTWPLGSLGSLDDDALAAYRARIEQYMTKAVREAKAHSSWINVNADYEAALAAFVQALLAPGEKNLFLADFAPAATRLARFGLVNGLSQVLLKLTSPGVPDLYQGCELWQFNLVDPDNRRPVDYAHRARLLAELKALLDAPRDAWAQRLRPLVDRPECGRIKFYLTWRTLRLRARLADLFRDGDYLPLAVSGAAAEHLCAFARRHDGRAVVVVVPRLLARLCGDLDPATAAPWGDTRIALPDEPAAAAWHNVLTGETHVAGESLAAAALLGAFPVALLASDAEGVAP